MSSRKEDTDARKEDSATGTPKKKPYTAPRLTTYGSIEKLTKTGGATTKDSGTKKKH